MTVTLYSKPGCGPCLATKNALASRGIPFDVVDVSKNEDALKLITDLGYRSVPVVVVSTDRHWGGEFRLDLITDLAAELRAETEE